MRGKEGLATSAEKCCILAPAATGSQLLVPGPADPKRQPSSASPATARRPLLRGSSHSDICF
jgi:hypothetical protein